MAARGAGDGARTAATGGARPSGTGVAAIAPVAIAIAVAIVALVVLSASQSRALYRERAVVATDNLARLLERQVAEVFAGADGVLRDAQFEFEREHAERGALDAQRFTRFLERKLAGEPVLMDLRATDAQGYVRYGAGVPAGADVNLSDRDAFPRLVADPSAGPLLYGPVVAKISRKWVVTLARALRAPDGRFAGMIFANVEAARFGRDFAGLELGSHGAATLRTADLALVARATVPAGGPAPVGSRRVSSQLQTAIGSSPHAGSYVAPTAIDGIERVNAYRRVGSLPLYVIVGLATDDYFTGWRREVAATSGLGTIALATVVAGAWLLRRAWRRQAVVFDALRESEELSSLAQQGGHVGTWTLDPDDRRLAGSDEWARIHDAAEGRAWTLDAWCARVDAADRADVEAAWGVCLADGSDFEHEYRFHCDSGAVRWFWTRGHANHDASGAILRFTGVTLDISQRKASEHELLRAKEAAESASVAKSAFLANMSHELRTPLNAITGMAYLMRRAGLDAEQAQRLDRIDAASRHLIDVVGAVLDLAKIEAGRLSLERVEFDPARLLKEVEDLLAHRAQARHLSLRVEGPAAEGRLLGDPTRIRQAVLNYVANAIKFTEQGSVTIRARRDDLADGRVELRIEVQDTGIGIEPSALARLFEPFEQADNSTTRHFGGTGLGLAITRRLARMMDGDTGCESEPGRGSTFWLTVRLEKAAPASGA